MSTTSTNSFARIRGVDEAARGGGLVGLSREKRRNWIEAVTVRSRKMGLI